MRTFFLPSNTQLDAILGEAEIQAGLIDAESRVLYLNATLLGYSPEDLYGRSLFEGIHPDDELSARQQFERCLKSPGSPVDLQFRKYHVHGSTRFLEAVLLNKLDDPDVNAIIVRYRDITEFRAAQHRTYFSRTFLAEVNSALSESLDYEATIDRILTLVLGDLGDWCSLDILDPNGSIVDCAMAHRDATMIQRVRHMRESSFGPRDSRFPTTRVRSTGEMMFVPRLTPEMLESAGLDDELKSILRDMNVRSFVAVPVKARGRVIGVLSLAKSAASLPYDEYDLELIQEVAHRMALHIDNAQLYRDAQRAQRRSALLAEITALLAESLDSANVLQQLARSTAAHFADICSVYGLDAEGRFYRAAVAHADLSQASLLSRLLEQPIQPHLQDLLGSIVKSGRPLLTALVTPQAVEKLPAGAYKDTIQQLTPLSSIIAPLIARGHRLGALSLALCNGNRRYSEEDVDFVQDLAQRAAIAIDNERLYRELQETARLKDIFLATVSHELRTPLTTIAGWAALIGRPDIDEVTFDSAVESIQRNVSLQTSLVDDLLDISRIVSGKMRLDVEPVDLGSRMASWVQPMQTAADGKNIDLILEVETGAGSVMADPTRMQQVIWNLLSNAIKFTPAGGVIRVKVRSVSPSGTEIVISDTGIGITSEFLPFVFDRFRQFDGSNTRRTSGLGLGLSIVKHLVELHGGTVSAESPGQGHGATFRVLLPRSEKATLAANKTSSS